MLSLRCSLRGTKLIETNVAQSKKVRETPKLNHAENSLAKWNCESLTSVARQLMSNPDGPTQDVQPVPPPSQATCETDCSKRSDSSNDTAQQADATETAEQTETTTFLWLRRADQLFVGLLMIAIVTLMGTHWVRLSHWGTKPVEIERMPKNEYLYRIDINTATWVEWMQLDGIGPVLAQRIVEDREKNGHFQSIDNLERVNGIGPKTIERIRSWLTIGPAGSL